MCVCLPSRGEMGLGQWERETLEPRVTGFDREQQESVAAFIPE